MPSVLFLLSVLHATGNTEQVEQHLQVCVFEAMKSYLSTLEEKLHKLTQTVDVRAPSSPLSFFLLRCMSVACFFLWSWVSIAAPWTQ
jgi:hypothetical protein